MNGKIKLKGRPVSASPKRDKKLDVRLTAEEYSMVIKMAAELGLGKSVFMRRKLLNNLPQTGVNLQKTALWMDQVALELSRAGNNINQLARYCNILIKNGMLSVKVTEQFNQQLKDYFSHQKNIESLLRRLLLNLSR